MKSHSKLEKDRIIMKIAKGYCYDNRQRNIFVILSVFLTSFMISIVFSLGCSYFETLSMQQIRSIGTTADVAITNISQEQYERLRSSKKIATVGINQRVGSVDTKEMNGIKLGLSWIDKTEWENHRIPTITDLNGQYPQKENEIMLPTWVLNSMGITDPKLGMDIVFLYQIGNDQNFKTGKFVLSGFYTDYSITRVGKKGTIYVSKMFVNQTGLSFNDISTGILSFNEKGDIEQLSEKLKSEIPFYDYQTFEFVPLSNNNKTSTIFPLGFIIIFIIISGYLLIYNILYISISNDINFFGLLKLNGCSKKQIKKIVWWQVFRNSLIGIFLGIVCSTIFSFIIVPFVMHIFSSGNIELGVKISFSPLIFGGTIIFTFLTVIASSMQPALKAGNISPIEALRFTGVNTNIWRKKRHRISFSRMAFYNIFRNPRSAFFSFMSLLFGLILFLVSTGLLASLNSDNFVNKWGESDFTLAYSIQREEDLISKKVLEKITKMDNIENLKVTYSAFPSTTMEIVYDQDVFGDYINSLNGTSGLDFSDEETLKKYISNFFGGVYAIDVSYLEELNKTLKVPIDLEEFNNGSIVLLSTVDNEQNPLIQPGKEISVIGTKGHCSFRVANGFLSQDFQSGRGKERGTAPDLYISKKALQQLSDKIKITRINFDTINKSYDKEVLAELTTFFDITEGIQIQSRYEKKQEINGYLMSSNILIMGLSIVFLLIGFMNFINTTAVSVNSRRYELATLESIGATKKQIRKMLAFEGGWYWAISFILLLSIGTCIYIPMLIFFRSMVAYATFSYPFFEVSIISIIILMICLTVPVIKYNLDVKTPLVKRLQGKY